MVRLALTFLPVAIFALVSAAPFYSQQPFKEIDFDSRCLPGSSIVENQAFRLLSYELDTYVSRKLGGKHLVGGVTGDKTLQQLQFCVVSADMECEIVFPPNCVRENVDYRFRVSGSIMGYLKIDGNNVRIVREYDDASLLSLSNEDGHGTRIAYKYGNGHRYVLATSDFGEVGRPILLELPQKYRQQQRFDIVESTNAKQKAEC
ncbi:hypothetical protein BG006_000676 [Podila minutissima]|uniref:Uncharacterized protein n=1 Tax=Podila minutissima TaxID=64525 RepID=A0A9P5SBM4_9FUNG|nr:hypothetical protein BG006_000676 [Podila minutissima]